ncbi:SubName: Full=Uncharacterized protein {ECO:0000313/EMBL:CCA66375.1} [Serendipita indica DSM 11827]|uniref:Uncharacterized protein n=1 Tax=Serendipita indica (strain DSM 11827) TaxID=1109443 RepID=G4T528_SERID|nr:SubName: Full=Uncharacterized protein {ECO:0000313/EMBL:CCA66375.1} [Serendipita indica DSM 11827]CCA66375.1 hypothetical protein PIIN_00061 [Serendipita indica DSM 11827]
MLRRDPTLIQIDQSAVKEVKAALDAKLQESSMVEDDSMLLDASDATRKPYNAVEEEKKRKAALSRNQRMGIADA